MGGGLLLRFWGLGITVTLIDTRLLRPWGALGGGKRRKRQRRRRRGGGGDFVHRDVSTQQVGVDEVDEGSPALDQHARTRQSDSDIQPSVFVELDTEVSKGAVGLQT